MKAAVQAASNYSVDRAFLLKHFIPMQIDCWRMKALVSRKVTLPWQRGESNWRRCWEHWPRRGHQSELVDRLVMESNSVRPISTLSLDFVANRLVGEPRCCRFLYRFPFAAAALLDDLFGCENHYGGSASIHSRPGLLRSCIDVRASSSTYRTQWLLDAAGCRNCAHQKFAGPTSLPQTSFGPRLDVPHAKSNYTIQLVSPESQQKKKMHKKQILESSPEIETSFTSTIELAKNTVAGRSSC